VVRGISGRETPDLNSEVWVEKPNVYTAGGLLTEVSGTVAMNTEWLVLSPGD
jgi:hypothetical protein